MLNIDSSDRHGVEAFFRVFGLGKVRENHTKYLKSQAISNKCILLSFSDIYMDCVLLEWIIFSVEKIKL